MDIAALIESLEGLSGPDRTIDERIGELIGLTPSSDYWSLGNKKFRRLPYFTGSVDAAMLVVEALLEGAESGGVTWSPRGPSWAEVDDGPQCSGANRAIALCLAALRRKQQVNRP